jgi:hypothetical protein
MDDARRRPALVGSGTSAKVRACVRRHGIPNLPDPKIVDRAVVLTLPQGRRRNSPLVVTADRACRKLLDLAGGSSTNTNRP